MGALFPLGHLVATPGAIDLLRSAGEDLLPALLERHRFGDWGDVPLEDARENEVSVSHGLRIISSYQVAGERLWVITERDRSATTLLLPEKSKGLRLPYAEVLWGSGPFGVERKL